MTRNYVIAALFLMGQGKASVHPIRSVISGEILVNEFLYQKNKESMKQVRLVLATVNRWNLCLEGFEVWHFGVSHMKGDYCMLFILDCKHLCLNLCGLTSESRYVSLGNLQQICLLCLLYMSSLFRKQFFNRIVLVPNHYGGFCEVAQCLKIWFIAPMDISFSL